MHRKRIERGHAKVRTRVGHHDLRDVERVRTYDARHEEAVVRCVNLGRNQVVPVNALYPNDEADPDCEEKEQARDRE